LLKLRGERLVGKGGIAQNSERHYPSTAISIIDINPPLSMHAIAAQATGSLTVDDGFMRPRISLISSGRAK